MLDGAGTATLRLAVGDGAVRSPALATGGGADGDDVVAGAPGCRQTAPRVKCSPVP